MIRILLVEDDNVICDAFEVAIHKNSRFQLVGRTGKQSEAIAILLSITVDVMILDLELDEGDGIHLLDEMNRKMSRLPEVITVTNTCSESILSCVRKKGSDFIYKKQNGAYSPQNILEIIEMTLPYFEKKSSDKIQRLALTLNKQKEAEYQQSCVERELEKIGFQSKRHGTVYIAEAICILMNAREPASIQITNDVYPVIAGKHQSSKGSVEKSMRNAIERVWSQKSIESLQELYPFYWDQASGRPTNTDFISNMAGRLRNH